MQEGYRGPYMPEEDIARWCSVLFENAAMMGRAASLEDAMGQLARNMALYASVDSCVVLVHFRDQYKPVASSGVEMHTVGQITPAGRAADALEKKEPAFADSGDLGLPGTDKYRHTSFLCVPLVSHGKPAGLAVLFSAGKRHEFPPSVLQVLSIMAIQGAHAIDDFRYKEELQKRGDELRRVYEIQRRITQSIDLEEASESIVENAPYITRLQYCMI
ncbi:MAG TPA: GAF domain-containing protein, partial [Methanocella sp.]|nr:GAF domain-containing protein [Methanocella sp.]